MKNKTTPIPSFPNQVFDLILEKDPDALVAAQLAKDAAEDYREAKDFIEKNGYTYTSDTMSGFLIREYPQVKQFQNAWDRLMIMLREYKVTLKAGGGSKPKRAVSPLIHLVQKR